jgi:hypothetical protein
MEKRLILAIGLSLLLVMAWSSFAPHPTQPPISAPVKPETKTVVNYSPEDKELQNRATFPVSLDKFEANFVESLGTINNVVFDMYPKDKFELKNGFFLPEKNLEFKKESASREEVVFVGEDKTKKIAKHFIFSKYNYYIDLELEITNLTNVPLNFDLPIILGVFNSGNQKEVQYQDVAVGLADKTRIKPSKT